MPKVFDSRYQISELCYGPRLQDQPTIKLYVKECFYLAACDKCKNQYVGSTSTEFKVRFRNHKSSMLNNKRTCELVHYNSFEHQICQISFIVIEQIVNHRNGIHLQQLLLTRDAYWTLQLFSLHPHGLNKRREFKSKNRICYNRLISFYCSPNFPRIYSRHSITVELLAIVVTFVIFKLCYLHYLVSSHFYVNYLLFFLSVIT